MPGVQRVGDFNSGGGIALGPGHDNVLINGAAGCFGDIATHAVVLAREGQGLSLVLVDLNQAGVKRETLKTLDPTRGHSKKLALNGSASRARAGIWRRRCWIAPPS